MLLLYKHNTYQMDLYPFMLMIYFTNLQAHHRLCYCVDNMSKLKTLYSILLPMYYVTNSLGFKPFHLSRKKCKFSKFCLLWSFGMMLFVNVYIISSIQDSMSVDPGFIATITDLFDRYFSLFGMLSAFLFQFIHLRQVSFS